MCVCACVCAQREWYMTYIARWITCHPKNKTNNNNESSRNCKCFAETSLAQLSMQTHTHANTHRMNFPSIRARISPAFGTLVLGVGYFSCRLLQPVQFAVDARLVRVVFIGVSKIRKKRTNSPSLKSRRQFASSSLVLNHFWKEESSIREFFFHTFFKNSFIKCSWSEFESTKRVPRNPPSGLFAIGAAPPTRGQYQYHNHQTGSQIHFSKLFGHANYYCCTHCVLENNPQPLSQSTLLYYIPYVYMLWSWPASWQWTSDLIRIESACVSLCKSDWTQYENPLKMAELLLKTGPCTICPKCR